MATKNSKILILPKLKNTKIKNTSIIYVALQGNISFGSQLIRIIGVYVSRTPSLLIAFRYELCKPEIFKIKYLSLKI